jgi:integrating conjugative element protein (TIGR03749 family)
VLRWERLPLSVPLVVDQERVVFVDRNVRVGVPSSVNDRLRVQSAAGAVYLRANAPIEPTRLQLQDAESGELILLDITADTTKDDQPLLEPIRIVTAASSSREKDSVPHVAVSSTPVPVVLTRYAAQNLYTPLRTVEALPGIRRVNLRRDLPLDTLLPSLPVQASALAAWRLDDHWVSAVRLRNTASQWLDLDPRRLQGDIATATFQHPSLGPHGQSSDTTVLYLVTRKRGLAASLPPTLSPIDAALNLPRPSQDEGPDDEE